MSAPPLELLDGEAFRERVAQGERIVAVFIANWCGYCRMFMPAFTAFSERADVATVAVDLSDDDDPWWEDANVDIIPTIVEYADGTEVSRLDGLPGAGLPPAMFQRWAAERHPGAVDT